MATFFVVTNSKAAPLVSDTGHEYVEADSAAHARDKVRLSYGHPAGLYALNVYANADAYHQNGGKPLLQWLCKQADIRTNGVTCECGARTHCVVMNSRAGTVDIHRCESCGKEQRIDMAEVA